MKKYSILGIVAMLGLTNGALASKVVQVKGSDTIVNVSQYIAEEYMAANKGARIAVTGGGSGTGIAALLNGTADIGMASRNIKEKEVEAAKAKGTILEEVVIGFDGLTVITNKENKVNDLSVETLGKIFRGEITNWKEIGGADMPIVVLSRDSSSGTHEYFKEHVVRQENTMKDAEYGKATLYMPSNQSIKQEVATNKGAIGYIGMGYMDGSVTGVKVDSIYPTVSNVANKSYPIAREVYWYVKETDNKEIKNLVEFALSEVGQQIVADEGFVPAK